MISDKYTVELTSDNLEILMAVLQWDGWGGNTEMEKALFKEYLTDGGDYNKNDIYYANVMKERRSISFFTAAI